MAISEIANAIPNVWNWANDLHTDFINRYGFLYACDFEARLNLDIIAALDFAKLDNQATSPAFACLVDSFETSATLALIAGSDRRSYRRLVKLLKKNWQPPDEALKPENEETPETIEGMIENFSFAVRKIEALRRIAHVAGKEASFLKNFYLDRRLANINTALLCIRKCLKKVISLTEGAA